MKIRNVVLMITLLCLAQISITGFAQRAPILIKCGDTLEAELTANDADEGNPYHLYAMNLNAGDQISVRAEPLGQFLDIGISIYELQFGERLERSVDYDGDAASIDILLSSSGTYHIAVDGHSDGRTGAYKLLIGCTFRDGTVIRPGDVLQGSQTDTTDQSSDTSPPSFSGFGFPGLASKDFSNVARLPIPPGIPMSGAVTPDGNEILGYLFNANAGDTVELNFNRLSGNQNLGLVVINDNSDIIFQASLVTTDSMTTRFTVPTSGEYTAGMFRMDLLPPDSPEATAFQVNITVNPE